MMPSPLSPLSLLSLDIPLILRLMASCNKSFGEVQARLREIDEANVRLDRIQAYKQLDVGKEQKQ